jgi:hypothetical protein
VLCMIETTFFGITFPSPCMLPEDGNVMPKHVGAVTHN